MFELQCWRIHETHATIMWEGSGRTELIDTQSGYSVYSVVSRWEECDTENFQGWKLNLLQQGADHNMWCTDTIFWAICWCAVLAADPAGRVVMNHLHELILGFCKDVFVLCATQFFHVIFIFTWNIITLYVGLQVFSEMIFRFLFLKQDSQESFYKGCLLAQWTADDILEVVKEVLLSSRDFNDFNSLVSISRCNSTPIMGGFTLVHTGDTGEGYLDSQLEDRVHEHIWACCSLSRLRVPNQQNQSPPIDETFVQH